MKKYVKMCLFLLFVCLFPLIIDKFIFGNKFASNISNETWAGFLGSYIGGIATLIAVFITIEDNNKKAEDKRKIEKEEDEAQRKFLIRPCLNTHHKFFNQQVSMFENDLVFDIDVDRVKKMRYNLSVKDRQLIQMKQNDFKWIFLRYSIRNIGAGSAVDVKIIINSFLTEIAIAKDETVNLFEASSVCVRNI